MNYFERKSAAERYARSRPYFHPLVVGLIKNFLELERPVSRALDVACGTGQSAIALKEIAAEIVGTDGSAEMLAQASRDDRIMYVRASAEELPFTDGSFDLATVALAFHWFDRVRFLTEVYRVLRSSGWLIVYDNGFLGQMKENADYERWHQNKYLARYPPPPRDWRPLTEDEAEEHGFQLVGRESYENEVSFSVEELADYLTTQSNVISAVEEGTEDTETVRNWLTDSITPLFTVPRGTFRFGGTIWYVKKIPSIVDSERARKHW